jgi:outer membrane translocation and assembly module TamA
MLGMIPLSRLVTTRRLSQCAIIAGLALWAAGCASIERGRYGVARLEISGQRAMAAQPLRECLLTRERDPVVLRLGAAPPRCSEPPFDKTPPQLKLWSWSWTDWPSFNRSVFEQDLQRILRWYRARGFYEAKVASVSFDPADAGRGLPCTGGDCEVEIEVVIDEGAPIVVTSVELAGSDALPPEVASTLRTTLPIRTGQRFDEVEYDRSRAALLNALRAASFAAAKVRGTIDLSPRAHAARVRFELTPGASYRFGQLKIKGQGALSPDPIRQVAGTVSGELYQPERIEEIRGEVLALGAFSAVEIEEHLDEATARVDLTLKVTLLASSALRLGVGLTSGASVKDETGQLESIPQWDVHVFGRYELRHVFDTLGAFHIEEQPRLIFGKVFPGVTTPEFGNIVSLKWNQPGLIEARTNLFAQSSWDYGPDPFLGFTRSDIMLRVGARRGFFTRRLVGTLAVQQDIFVVPDGDSNPTSDGSPTPSSYTYAFLEQDLRLDLRDQALWPREGAHLLLNVTESPRVFASAWASLRLAPDFRFFVPLPLGTVLAWRYAMGALFIFAKSDDLDDISRRLGPSAYRLRGGGANSVRGFLPGKLGDSDQGGLRRWESMLEWRVRLGDSLAAVAFLDFGDVNEDESFRFTHLNTTLGLGVRYFTFVGPIRLDAGFRIPSLQRTDGSNGIEEDADELPILDIPGALHFTIGDSF